MINLYEFQQEDLAKLKRVKSRLNAGEMGTGKTPSTVALDQADGVPDRTLVVAPMQVLQHWHTWFEVANRPMAILDPKDRAGSLQQFKLMPKGSVLGVHWEALRLLDLEKLKWDHVIADEVHRVQNRKAQQTRALKKIKPGLKTGLSGTPVTGGPQKYWSVLNWLYPNDFRAYWKFYESYVNYDIVYPQGYHKVTGPKNELELLERVDPFYVRHLKKERCCDHHPEGVMPWLPDKYYTPIYVSLAPAQRKAYEEMKKEMIAWVGDHADTPLVASVVVAQMMRLQQFALAFAHVDTDGYVTLVDPSSKLDAVMQVLEDNPEESIVVFSQFNKLLHLLEQRLQKAKIEYVVYTGETRNTRDQDKERFIDGSARVFLGNIAAGGVGLDGLQRASSTVIFTDRLWSPSLNNQAEDRLWRDGQDNAVQVIDIIARDTVDLGRHQKLEMTWDWIQRLLGDK